jgi:hypothetical protein
LNAVRIWLFFESYRITSMGNAVIVLYSWPVFALIYSYFLLGESLKKRDFLLMGLAFIGMAIVYSGGNLSFENRDFLGMSLMLASALMYALMIVLIRREDVERAPGDILAEPRRFHRLSADFSSGFGLHASRIMVVGRIERPHCRDGGFRSVFLGSAPPPGGGGGSCRLSGSSVYP